MHAKQMWNGRKNQVPYTYNVRLRLSADTADMWIQDSVQVPQAWKTKWFLKSPISNTKFGCSATISPKTGRSSLGPSAISCSTHEAWSTMGREAPWSASVGQYFGNWNWTLKQGFSWKKSSLKAWGPVSPNFKVFKVVQIALFKPAGTHWIAHVDA